MGETSATQSGEREEANERERERREQEREVIRPLL